MRALPGRVVVLLLLVPLLVLLLSPPAAASPTPSAACPVALAERRRGGLVVVGHAAALCPAAAGEPAALTLLVLMLWLLVLPAAAAPRAGLLPGAARIMVLLPRGSWPSGAAVLALALPLVVVMACLLHRPAEEYKLPPCFTLLPAGRAAAAGASESLPATPRGAAALVLPAVHATAGCWLL